MALLGYLFIALPFLIAILFALALCLLVWGLYGNPAVGMWLTMMIFLWGTIAFFLPGIQLGLYLYPQDLAFAAIALVAALRLGREGRLARLPKPWAALGILMAGSFAVGVVRYGSTAGVEFRDDFYFWAGTAYFMSFPVTRNYLSNFVRIWIFGAVVILSVVYFRWLSDGLGLDWVDPIWRYIDKSGVVLRVVNSGECLLLGQTLILLVYAMATGGGLRQWRFLVPFLALTVLLLQHRSVWAAAFAPVVLAFALVGQARGRIASNLMVFALASATVLVPLYLVGEGDAVTTSLSTSAESAVSTEKGTFVGRVEGWQQLLGDWASSGTVGYAVGKPYGSGYARIEEGHGEIAYAPHNYFVQTLLRTGLLGLVALVSTYVFALRWLSRKTDWASEAVTPAALFALLVSQLLYYIPYSPNFLQGIVLGLALATVRDSVLGWRSPHLAEQAS